MYKSIFVIFLCGLIARSVRSSEDISSTETESVKTGFEGSNKGGENRSVHDNVRVDIKQTENETAECGALAKKCCVCKDFITKSPEQHDKLSSQRVTFKSCRLKPRHISDLYSRDTCAMGLRSETELQQDAIEIKTMGRMEGLAEISQDENNKINRNEESSTTVRDDVKQVSLTKPYDEFIKQTIYTVGILHKGEKVLYETIGSASDDFCLVISWSTEKITVAIKFCVEYFMYSIEMFFIAITYVVRYLITCTVFLLVYLLHALLWVIAFVVMTLLTYPVTLLLSLFQLLMEYVIYPVLYIIVIVLTIVVCIVSIMLLYDILNKQQRRYEIVKTYKAYDSEIIQIPKADDSDLDEAECCVCYNNFDDLKNVRLNPCGHSNMCETCVSKIMTLGNGLCPLCRSDIIGW